MSKRVRAARHYQRKDSPVRLLALAAVPGIRKDIRESFQHLGTLVPQERAMHFARAGDWHALKAHVNWAHYREILKAPFARIGKLRQAAGELGAKKINGAFHQARRQVRFRKAVGDRFNFDLYDAKTLARIRKEQDRLITAMEDSARDSIDAIISSAAITGLGPEDIVDDIRDLIGLNDRQAVAVLNYQRGLFDQGYDESEIERLVGEYTDRALDYRAGMIAQTESVRASNAGLHDAYTQAIERGALPTEAITRHWQLGDSPCPVCESIPDNSPDGVGVDEDFDSSDGPVEDPPVHPNCMCSVEYITNLDLVPDM